MNDKFKNLAIIALGVLCLLLLIGTVSSCSSAYRQKFAKDKEMATRLDLEEKLSKFTHDKVAVDEKLKASDKEILEVSLSLAAAKKELLEEQMVTQSLKEELTKVSKVKEVLEKELKEYKSKLKKQ